MSCEFASTTPKSLMLSEVTVNKYINIYAAKIIKYQFHITHLNMSDRCNLNDDIDGYCNLDDVQRVESFNSFRIIKHSSRSLISRQVKVGRLHISSAIHRHKRNIGPGFSSQCGTNVDAVCWFGSV